MSHRERFELFRAGFATMVTENGAPRFAGRSWSSHEFVWADSADTFNQYFGTDSSAVAGALVSKRAIVPARPGS